ncbi:MAG TPA: hypothetical protein VFH36_02420 [Acidimicrobiales bacterium]|jgi:hypothetical protein|nr:hypothetical protein [Acidimicrobiales bacterium]
MDLSRLTPSDAVVALRGLERRYRGLFAGLGEDETPDDVAHRVVGGWSPIEHIVAGAWAISAADRALVAVLTGDAPVLDPADVLPEARPKPGQVTGTVHERLAELGLDANAAADRVEHTPASDWDRTGTVAGTDRTVTALDLARSAVDAGVTHLRAAEELLAAVRRTPPPEPS